MFFAEFATSGSVGDLADAAAVHRIADQANGRFDAVIHNAGLYVDHARVATVDDHARVLAVNVRAPYLLTVLIERPERLIYRSSGMHHDAHPSLDDIHWTTRPWNGPQAYIAPSTRPTLVDPDRWSHH